MRLYAKEHVYDHPWELVTFAHWNKYPNPRNSHILDVNVLAQHVDRETGSLHTVRLFQAVGHTPWYIKKLVPDTSFGYSVEFSSVNASQKRMVLENRNISYNNFLQVVETCTYEQCAEEPSKTVFRQEATVQAFVPSLISGKTEGWALSSFSNNAPKGLEIMEELCARFKSEGFLRRLLPKFAVGRSD